MTAPLAVWCLLEGGLSIGRVLVVYLVIALLMGVICALSLGLSAWTTRTTTSSVLAYLTVFALTVGTGVVFGLLPDGTVTEVRQDADVLGALSQAARLLRQEPTRFEVGRNPVADPEPGPVWPYGLGFQLVLAAAAMLLTERKLRAPAGTLPTGQRVA